MNLARIASRGVILAGEGERLPFFRTGSRFRHAQERVVQPAQRLAVLPAKEASQFSMDLEEGSRAARLPRSEARPARRR
jgi:hypothetical protein